MERDAAALELGFGAHTARMPGTGAARPVPSYLSGSNHLYDEGSMVRKMTRSVGSQRGAAIVETIFATLFLLFIMFGMVELARAWFTQQLATAAVREAVRAGAVAKNTDVTTNGTARIDAVLTAGGIPSSKVLVKTVNLVAIPGSTDQQVVANVTVRFNTVFPLLLPNLGTIDIPQSAAMRWEGSGT
jgi:Flp pilus assembly protein TadG